MASPLTLRIRLYLALTLVLVAILASGFWLLRRVGSPASARLLPEGDAVLYLNLRPVRLATHFGDQPVKRDPEYDQFVQATGVQFERDLDEVALVVHRPEIAVAGDQTILERRYSEVFIGRYDHAKLANYLKSFSATTERMADREVFVVPHEGRTVRVALLSDDTVAVSNSSDATNLRHIIDAFTGAATANGPSLLRDYYKRVPLASSAWAIARLDTPNGESSSIPLPGGLNFTLPKETVTIVSLGVNTSLATAAAIELKAEAITPSVADGKQVTENVSSFLQLLKAIEASSKPGGPDPDVKHFFDSLQVQQKDSSAVVTAELPVGFLKKVLSDVPEINVPVQKPEEKKPLEKSAKPSQQRAR